MYVQRLNFDAQIGHFSEPYNKDLYKYNFGEQSKR